MRNILLLREVMLIMRKTFEMNENEYKEALEWEKEHKKECPIKDTGAIGGKTSVKFTMTSLGCGITVECDCGASVDVTDVSCW